MPTAVRLHVTLPILAITAQLSKHNFVDIPAGSVIETSGDLSEPGLHPVTFEGQQLLVFTRDIAERTEPVKEASSESKIMSSPSASRIRVYRTNKPV